MNTKLMEIGKPLGLAPGHTSTIRRIEGGMLSYQADMDCNVNPFELGLDRLVDLEMDADFIGKNALKKIEIKEYLKKFNSYLSIFGRFFARKCLFFRNLNINISRTEKDF